MAAPNGNVATSPPLRYVSDDLGTPESADYLQPTASNSEGNTNRIDPEDTGYSYAANTRPAATLPQSGEEMPPPYTMASPPIYQPLVGDQTSHRYAQTHSPAEYEAPYMSAYEEIERHGAPTLPSSSRPSPKNPTSSISQIKLTAGQQLTPAQGGISMHYPVNDNVVHTTNVVYVQQQPANIRTWLPWSIISLVLLFLPLGIPATILSALAIADKKQGRLEQAQLKAKAALILNIISTVLFGIIFIFIALPIGLIAACCAGLLIANNSG